MVLLLDAGRSCGTAGDKGRARAGNVLLAARVVVALYDELCAHDEPHTPDRQWRTLSTMTRPPDDRSDEGLPAELREQLEEGAEEARRFAAALEHQHAARQLVSAYQAGRPACPEGYAVVAAAVDWAHAGIGRARPHRPISQPALRTLFGCHLEQLRPGQPVTEADWEHGLAWALAERVPREPVFGIDRQLLEPDGPAGLALLTRCRWSDEEGFDPSAALVDHARDTGYRLASATWRFILEQLRPDEAFEGRAGQRRRGSHPAGLPSRFKLRRGGRARSRSGPEAAGTADFLAAAQPLLSRPSLAGRLQPGGPPRAGRRTRRPPPRRCTAGWSTAATWTWAQRP
jgi:hypothetical protein